MIFLKKLVLTVLAVFSLIGCGSENAETDPVSTSDSGEDIVEMSIV